MGAEAERLEPYAECLRLIYGDVSPQEAAECIGPILCHAWPKPLAFPESTPLMLQRFWDEMAWRRFETDGPVSLQLVCAHFLYRAAASLSDPSDAEPSLILMVAARQLVKSVLLVWLGDRDCPHCIEMRTKLQANAEKGLGYGEPG